MIYLFTILSFIGSTIFTKGLSKKDISGSAVESSLITGATDVIYLVGASILGEAAIIPVIAIAYVYALAIFASFSIKNTAKKDKLHTDIVGFTSESFAISLILYIFKKFNVKDLNVASLATGQNILAQLTPILILYFLFRFFSFGYLFTKDVFQSLQLDDINPNKVFKGMVTGERKSKTNRSYSFLKK